VEWLQAKAEADMNSAHEANKSQAGEAARVVAQGELDAQVAAHKAAIAAAAEVGAASLRPSGCFTSTALKKLVSYTSLQVPRLK
jgi:hypothetical protein